MRTDRTSADSATLDRAATGCPSPYRVTRRRRETGDTFTLEIEPVDRGDAIEFVPGQFNMIAVPGVGEVPISVSGRGRSSGALRHTVRSVGNVTDALGRQRVGDELGLRGPFGTPWPMELLKGHDVVVVTGGIGLAPLRPVIVDLIEQRPSYGRITLLYGARSPRDLLFRRELARWRGSLELDVHVTVDRAEREWRGDVGVVTHLIRRARFDRDAVVALICGPEIMMRAAAQELLRLGVDEDRLWLSMERNMKCGVGLCGHCQFGPEFVCRDGPVFAYDRIARLLGVREV